MSTIETRRAGWERFVPLTGLLAVVLWIVGVAVFESESVPDEDEGAQLLVQHYEENSGTIIAGAFLFMLGVAAFVWFLGSIRARFLTAEGGVAKLTAVVFGTGLLTAAMGMGFVAPEAAAAFSSQEVEIDLEAGAVQALSLLSDGFFIAGEAAVAGFFLAVGLAILRTRAFPVWLGWVSLLFGVAALIPWVGWAVFIWGLPLWVLVTSIWLFLRKDDRAVETRTVAT